MDEHIREATDEDLVGALRSDAVVVAELQARQLACVGELVRREREDPLRRGEGELRFDRLVPLVTAHVVCALGISKTQAEGMVVLSDHLARVLPETLDAVVDFRLDVERARVLSEATSALDDAAARRVQAQVLGGLRVPPREVRAAAADVVDPSDPVQAAEADLPVRPWRSCSARTLPGPGGPGGRVVNADADEARRRREQAVRDRCVRTGPCVDGMGSLWGRLPAEDAVVVEDGIAALGRRLAPPRSRRAEAGCWPAAGGRVRGPVPPRPGRPGPPDRLGGRAAVGGPGGGDRPARRHLPRRRGQGPRAG